jgi:hypothetical protein
MGGAHLSVLDIYTLHHIFLYLSQSLVSILLLWDLASLLLFSAKNLSGELLPSGVVSGGGDTSRQKGFRALASFVCALCV